MKLKIGVSIFVFALFLSLLIHTASSKSVAYDEIIYAPAGLLYWNAGPSTWNLEHPPLQKLLSAIPWLITKAKLPPLTMLPQFNSWSFGYEVFFYNNQPGPSLLSLSRIPSIFISMLLALGVFWLVLTEFGMTAALIALLVTTLDPLILANGALAMNDIFITTFFFLTFAFFIRWLNKPDQFRYLVMSGIMAGSAIGSKFSGILIFPALFLTTLCTPSTNPHMKKAKWLGAALIVAISVLIVLVLYHFNFNLLRDSLQAGFSFHNKSQTIGFFHGPISAASGWFYFPIVLLIKTPIPLLILWPLSIIILIQRNPNRNFLLAFVIPATLVLMAALISKNHFGVRYLLPMMPCLAVLVGSCWTFLQRQEKISFVLALLWLAIETLAIHPHHMTYFNQIIGGSKNGYLWLDGSNQDWGQDLKRLGQYWEKQGKPALLLSYVGSGRPEAWGLRYQDVFSPAITSAAHEKILFPADVDKEFFAISANLRAHPECESMFEWLNHKKPAANIGNTIFVYDISHDVESVERIADIYRYEKNQTAWQRQKDRLTFLKNQGTTKELF